MTARQSLAYAKFFGDLPVVLTFMSLATFWLTWADEYKRGAA